MSADALRSEREAELRRLEERLGHRFADLRLLEGSSDIEVTSRGLIAADPETMATSAPGVWAGGDVVYGPRILIEAVRDGQKAARSIEASIQGKPLRLERSAQMQPAASPRRGFRGR